MVRDKAMHSHRTPRIWNETRNIDRHPNVIDPMYDAVPAINSGSETHTCIDKTLFNTLFVPTLEMQAQKIILFGAKILIFHKRGSFGRFGW